jgi:hypothetical protein
VAVVTRLALLAKIGVVVAMGAAGAGIGLAIDSRGSTSELIPVAAWIDEPLDGMVTLVEPIVITAHATDPAGIIAVSLAVDDAEVAVFGDGDGATPELWTAPFSWSPPGPGMYVLTVRGTGASGSESMSAPVTVVVLSRAPDPEDLPERPTTTLAEPEPLDTTSPTAIPDTTAPPGTAIPPTTASPSTTSPTTTSPPATTAPATTTPTTTSCVLTPPVLVSPADGATVGGGGAVAILTVLLNWQNTGCLGTGVVVQVSREASFTRIAHQSLLPAGSTSWVTPNLVSGAEYHWRVATVNDGLIGPWSSVWRFTKQ